MRPIEYKLRYEQAVGPELRAMFEDDPDLAEGDGYSTLPARRGKNLKLSPVERELLSSVGLPENGPMLAFELNDPEPIEGIPHCFQIGSTPFGDPVCLDTKTREVVYFNHDRGMERVLVNSSLMKLAECLAVFMEHSNLPLDGVELHKRRLAALIEVDPALASQDSVWRHG